MKVGLVKIHIHVPYVYSLKEKRMIVKSICTKIHNKFNVSVAEVEDQDIHQTIVLGVAFVAGNSSLADSITDNVVKFIDQNTEGDIFQVYRELI